MIFAIRTSLRELLEMKNSGKTKEGMIFHNLSTFGVIVVCILLSTNPIAVNGFKNVNKEVHRACIEKKSLTHFKMNTITHFTEIEVRTNDGVSVHDITEEIESIIKKSRVREGLVTVLSKHSTVGISINEMEPRMVNDIRQFFLNIVPPTHPWLHNDLDYREGPTGYPGGDEAWRDMRRTQPVNAHSHLIAMLLGTSESVPISKGKMQKGTFQNILMIEADGFQKKKRTVGVQIIGQGE